MSESLRILLETWCFFLLLVTPRVFGVDFEYTQLTILSNAMTLMVRLRVWQSPEHMSTACAVAVVMFVAYWSAVLFGYEELVWTPRNVFIHMLLPADSIVLAVTQRVFTRRNSSLMLTAAITTIHSLIGSFVDPPPYDHMLDMSLAVKMIGGVGSVLTCLAVQWALHFGMHIRCHQASGVS